MLVKIKSSKHQGQHQNKNRASSLRHIKILSTTCLKQFPAETAIPVFHLVLGWHEYVPLVSIS